MARSLDRSALLEKLAVERTNLDELLAEMTPEQMEAAGGEDGWSVKDHVAHVTAWDRRGCRWLLAAAEGAALEVPEPGTTWDDMDRLNAEGLAAERERSVEAVLVESREAYAALVAVVEGLTEAVLRRRVRAERDGGLVQVSTLVRWRYRHLREHCRAIEALVRAWREEAPRGGEGAVGGEAEAGEAVEVVEVGRRAGRKGRGRAAVKEVEAAGTGNGAGYVVGQRIRDMHEDERPRERLLQYGAAVLSNAELLAILLRVGVQGENAVMLANRILTSFGGLPGVARASAGEIGVLRGLGEAKACQLLAAIELGKRLAASSPEALPIIRSPADAANLVMLEMSLLDHEQLRVMLLDTKNRVHAMPTVYKGTVNSSQVRVAEVFKEAVRHNYPALIVVHNHPSGDPAPSRDDVRVTKELVQAGELLGINVLDHLVIGQGTFVSMKERGLGF